MKKAFMAGVAGTVVMTVFSFVSNYLPIPKTDFHGMIASHIPMGAAFTWIVYFGLGVVLAYLYGTYLKAKLPAHSYGRGIIYALILWGFMEVVLMPLSGAGFFSGGVMSAMGAFLGIGLYGATVGYLYEH